MTDNQAPTFDELIAIVDRLASCVEMIARDAQGEINYKQAREIAIDSGRIYARNQISYAPETKG
jgi:hypothetical protein